MYMGDIIITSSSIYIQVQIIIIYFYLGDSLLHLSSGQLIVDLLRRKKKEEQLITWYSTFMMLSTFLFPKRFINCTNDIVFNIYLDKFRDIYYLKIISWKNGTHTTMGIKIERGSDLVLYY